MTDAICRACGETNPPDQHQGGHVVTESAHAPDCDGYRCGETCPVPVQELCGPLEEVAS